MRNLSVLPPRPLSRRSLLTGAASVAGLVGTRSLAAALESSAKPLPFTISLAEWSLHKTIFDGKLDNLDFPKTARREFGIEAVEYVNQFF
jgi:hypothetical protein